MSSTATSPGSAGWTSPSWSGSAPGSTSPRRASSPKATSRSTSRSAPRTRGGSAFPGEELPGVYSALEFLLAVNKGPEGVLGRKGRTVCVIGGGDVALDAARSSHRLAAAPGSVTVLYRQGPEAMPAGAEERRDGAVEGVRFVYRRSPVRILGTARVEGLVVQATRAGAPDARGRPSVELVPDSEETIPCDTVIAAVGERADLTGLPSELDLRVSAHGWPEGGRPEWATDLDGVFASGGKSVVYAMAAGSAAAAAIDAYIAHKLGRAPLPRPGSLGGASPPALPDGYGGPSWHL